MAAKAEEERGSTPWLAEGRNGKGKSKAAKAEGKPERAEKKT